MSDTIQITSALKQWAIQEMGFLKADDHETRNNLQSLDLDGYIFGFSMISLATCLNCFTESIITKYYCVLAIQDYFARSYEITLSTGDIKGFSSAWCKLFHVTNNRRCF